MNFWERIQAATKAARSAWFGFNNTPAASYGLFYDISNSDIERVKRYGILWDYYAGRHKKHLAVRMTPSGPGPDDNVIINLSRRAVNKGAYFLFGEPVRWDLAEGIKSQAEKFLDGCWRSDESRMSFLVDSAINGGVTGDVYFQIKPQSADFPRFVNLNPSMVFPTYNPDDIDELWAYELRWRSAGTTKRTIHALGDSGETWEVFNERLVAGRWEMEGEVTVWPWEFPAIVHVKNLPNPNVFYGLSDLEDADLNDAINQVSSNLNRIIRLFANPIIWGRMMGIDSLDPSKIAMAKSEEGMLSALELAKDLGGAQEFVKYLRTMWSEVTNVPENDPDRLRIGAQSGFALQVLFYELVQKTKVKQSLYGAGLVELNRRALIIGGYVDPGQIKLHWKTPLPTDPGATTAANKFELDSGLASKETISEERGYDWSVEQERLSAEKSSESNLGAELLKAFERGQ